MAVEVTFVYEGNLRTRATHGPSETELVTDAPVDNHGRGESFSPTDLVATALGTCMLTTMGIYAQTHGLDLTDASAVVRKEMVADPLRRVAALPTRIVVPRPIPPHHREALERVARECPVMQSVHPRIDKPILFEWVD
ncbi:MAG: OsmC family protein [Candidatus Eisenbacteria bacterium]|uniref:OsmC family protein n=1 Tax=Eiseniibacteriota bacterium TaxID=2212470 RepID=A0A956LXC5_UNCEI|nr:OsmC family protein [Candidatus Eisenbacteria bacterium]